MAWTEPLHVEARAHSGTVTAAVEDNDGNRVAVVLCPYDQRSRCGAFGTMDIRRDGTPLQRTRAAVLLTRAALQAADDLQLDIVFTDVTPAASRFVELIIGPAPVAGTRRSGRLHEIRTAALDRSNALGRLTRATPADESDIGADL